MISNRKAALYATVFALAVMVGASCFADDVVGVMGVDAGTNDVTEVTMPFSPMGEGLPADFISGNFMGDGSPLSDRLYVYSRATGLMTNALFSADGWLDPATLSNSCMTAAHGDTIYFTRTDVEPISFYLWGRAESRWFAS